nr:hypothetical protein [Tanacetum cinerariifolium]
MLEKGSYVPWSGPYQIDTIRDPGNTTIEPHKRMQTQADFTGEEKKQFEADIDAMSAILLGIPNDIYNYVDASYYVTRPPFINDFDDTQPYDFQGDANYDDQTDNLTTNQAYVKNGRIDVQSKNVGNVRYGGRNIGKIATSLGNTNFVPKATGNTTVV